MANVLVVPTSGSIIFDSQTAGSSTISPLSTAPRLSYDNAGGINIQSYVTATSALDRFTVDGTNGRLFSVSDALTGSIFSVNDISGLPIIEVNSSVTDVITMGTYGTNALVVSGGNVAIGTATPGSAKLTVAGSISSNGGSFFSQVDLPNLRITSGGISTVTALNNALLNLVGKGSNKITLDTGIAYFNSSIVLDSASTYLSFNRDTFLYRDGANTLAQRNSTNPQEFRIYNTYTDSANYERGFFKWDTNTFKIGLSAGGTGVNRNLEFVAGGSTRMTIQSAGRVTIETGEIAGSSNVNFKIFSRGSEMVQFDGNQCYFQKGVLLQGNGISNATSLGLNWGTGGGPILSRFDVGTLNISNGNTPMAIQLYGYNVNSSNYERFFVKTNVGATSATQIGLSADGTGQNRNLEFVTGGSTRMTITSGGTTTVSGVLEVYSTVNGGRVAYYRTNASVSPNCQFVLDSPTNGNSGVVLQENNSDKFGIFYNSNITSGNRLADTFELYSFVSSTPVFRIHQSSLLAISISSSSNVTVHATTESTSTTTGALVVSGGCGISGSVYCGNDVEITDSTKGVILKSPNGTRYRITVNDSGVLTTTAL